MCLIEMFIFTKMNQFYQVDEVHQVNQFQQHEKVRQSNEFPHGNKSYL